MISVNDIRKLIQNGYYSQAMEIIPTVDTKAGDMCNIGAEFLKAKQPLKAVAILNTVKRDIPVQAHINTASAYRTMGCHQQAKIHGERAIMRSGIPGNISRAFRTAVVFPEADLKSLKHAWDVSVQDIPQYRPRKPGRKEGPLRVGFLSSGLHTHPIANVLMPFLRNSSIETYLYSIGKSDDTSKAMGELVGGEERWRNMAHLPIDGRCAYIRRDQLDILVIVDGHFSEAIEIAERRPVPIQISWMGWPGSTYSKAIDFRIADYITEPKSDGGPEKLRRTKGPFLAYESLVATPIIDRPERPITFGSFNNWRKMSEDCIQAWLAILDAVPGSRLILKCPAFDDRAFAEAIEAIFDGRCECRALAETPEGHIEQYGDFDIALDPWNYTGTITTCEALSMGVPVVTLAGNNHQARVSASILHGWASEWITHTQEEYIAAAVKLAKELPNKVEVAERFKQAPICDTEKRVAEFEKMLHAMMPKRKTRRKKK